MDPCESVPSGQAICRLCKQMRGRSLLIHMHKTTHMECHIEATGIERREFALNGSVERWTGLLQTDTLLDLVDDRTIFVTGPGSNQDEHLETTTNSEDALVNEHVALVFVRCFET